MMGVFVNATLPCFLIIPCFINSFLPKKTTYKTLKEVFKICPYEIYKYNTYLCYIDFEDITTHKLILKWLLYVLISSTSIDLTQSLCNCGTC